jgi:serine/threonine protein kinase
MRWYIPDLSLLELITIVKETYKYLGDKWGEELDCDLKVLKAKFLLQRDLFDQWLHDFGFALTGEESIKQQGSISIRKQRLLKQHEAIEAILGAVSDEMKKLQKLQLYLQGKYKLTKGDKDESSRVLAEIDHLLAGLHRLLPPQNLVDLENRTVNSLKIALERKVKGFKEQMPEFGKKIQAARVKIITTNKITVGDRSSGLLDDKKHVIIEWKRYDGMSRDKEDIKMRIDDLARMLGADTNKPEELLTLRCLGYFCEPSEHRYGFVSEYPPGSSVSTLKALLDGSSAETLPSLKDRYQIAHALGLSLAILHTAEWLHKSIRSHNVLFSSSIDHGIAWTRPYLAGFEYSRPDQTDALSETSGDSASFNLYRHPSSQGIPLESYRREFDIYSFGVLLVEIGSWRSARKLWDEKSAAAEFRENLIIFTKEKMAHYMGVKYRDAALKCLTGELCKRSDGVLKAFLMEVVEILGRCVEAMSI